MPPPPHTDPVDLVDVDVAIDGHRILRSITWRVAAGERWVIVGPNGAGKTTLVRLLAGWSRVVAGRASIVGRPIGRTDLRALRPLIGYSSQALIDQLRPSISVAETVMAGAHGALETWWHRYERDDRVNALAHLATFGIPETMADRPWSSCSSGERQRVLLARAFASDPALIVLDEPTAGLDVGGREDLVARLGAAAATTRGAMVLVTHHLEEIPPAFDRVVLLRDGALVAAGPADDLLTSTRLSRLYDTPLVVERVAGRWRATGAGEVGPQR